MRPDYIFIGLVVVITVFGLVMLTSASSDLARSRFGNSFHYLNHQLLYGFSAGLAGFFIGIFVYYRRWEKWATLLLGLTILLLLLVFTPLGFTAKGASRWLAFSDFTVQPAEILKLTLLIYLAAWLGKGRLRSRSFFQGLLPFMILLGFTLVLVILQPSTTTAVIIFVSALAAYFTAGAKIRFVVTMLLLAAAAFSLLVYVTPYRLERVLTFFNSEGSELGAGYHMNQSLIAIGSGGFFGVGYGKSAAKLSYLPEAIGDSIFAVIAEELGFLGAGLLILAFLFLILRGLKIAKRAPDNFGKLMVTGFITLIGAQTFTNIAAASGLIPLTGVPLPFISFGGTALAVFLTMSGIIANVSKYK